MLTTLLREIVLQRSLHDASAETIYRQFVEARVASAEQPSHFRAPDVLEPEPEPQQMEENQEICDEPDQQLPVMLTAADDRWVAVCYCLLLLSYVVLYSFIQLLLPSIIWPCHLHCIWFW